MEFDLDVPKKNNDLKKSRPVEIDIKIMKFRKTFKTLVKGLTHEKLGLDEEKLKAHVKILKKKFNCAVCLKKEKDESKDVDGYETIIEVSGDRQDDMVNYLTEETNLVSPDQITVHGVV